MSRLCPCGNPIPKSICIGNVRRNLQRRKFCLDCSPFGSHNTRDLTQPRPDKNARFLRYQERLRRERKEQLVSLLGGKCSACGYNRCTAALEFHHRDPAEKRFNLAKNNLLKRWDIVLAEAQKCDLLCANCHREWGERLRGDVSEMDESN